MNQRKSHSSYWARKPTLASSQSWQLHFGPMLGNYIDMCNEFAACYFIDIPHYQEYLLPLHQ